MPHYTTEYSTSSPRSSGAGRVSSRAYSRGHQRGDSGYRSHYEAENSDISEREEREERERRHGSRHHRTSSLYGRQPPDSPVDDRYSYELEHSSTVLTTAPEVAYTHPEGISVPAPYSAHALGAPPAPKITVSAYEYDGFEHTYYPQQPDSRRYQQHHKRYPEHEYREEDLRRPVPQDSYSGHRSYSTESPSDPYHSNHSYSHQPYSHRNHPQSPTAGSYRLRRVPSNHFERYSASPPSPTDSEASREVNGYGRVPLWYEERVAFTRYT